jgi:outer membrane protein assembly factor BamA
VSAPELSWRCFALALLACALSACAHVPPNRYGVKSVKIEGMRVLDEDALKLCLTSAERPRAGFTLGAFPPETCGKPPFDGKRWHVRLWYRPFPDWPLYDRVVLARDQERILRWFEARGFHNARVVGVALDPTSATEHDAIDPKTADPGCKRLGKKEGCAVRLRFEVAEGEPTRITEFAITGLSQLPAKLRTTILKKPLLQRDARFDEASYESEKQRIISALQDEGYALVSIQGEARIDRAARTAAVTLAVQPGPVCEFGTVQVEGAPSFLADSVRALSLIDRGDRFSFRMLQRAQRSVFSSGGFMSVSVTPVLPTSGNVVDVRVLVAPGRKHRYGLGLGIQAGIVTRGDTWDPISVPQWDLHLIAKYEQQRFLSGPRTLLVDDRPAMIVQEPFPGFTAPKFGNELRAQMRQAGVFEAGTTLQTAASYIWGPDPFDTFFRHRIDTSIGLERRFLREERLYLSVGIKNSVYRVPAGEVTKDGGPPSASSLLTNLYLRTRLDYRDNETQPHQGFMLQTELQVAGVDPISSWSYLRGTPDARVYIPLPFRMTFAMRFALGLLFIYKADKALDDLSRELGPRDYRLRGGGATSNRGFLPGELGDGPDGGTRRWEGSAELRLPVTNKFGLVGFFDAGDVSKKPKLRWKYPQAASGVGLRYYTLVGALRLDFAWRIKNLQVIGPDNRDPGGEQNVIDFGFAKMQGAIHLTIGESF